MKEPFNVAADGPIDVGEEKYRRLIEMTSEGFWFISPEFITLDVNHSFCRMLGYAREEMLGHSIFEFVNEENKQIFLKSTAKMGEQDHRSYEIVLQKKSGETIDCLFNATTVRDKSGEIEGAFAFITDISERKRAEEALKGSQRQLADIIDFLPDATIVIDKEGKVIAWNRETEKMTGYKSEEMLGKGDYEYSRAFYREKRPIIVDLVLLPQESLEREYHTITRDGDMLRGESTVTVVRGEKRHLSAWARPIYDAAGEIVGAIECIRDVTELEQYRQHLEEMIVKRTEELQQAKEAAELAARAKSDFLANMSHEIRTPMNAIIGFSGLALKTDLTVKQYDYVKKIETSAKSLLGIINDILDFSKIEAGRMEMESIGFRLDDVINNIVNVIAIEGAKKGIEILSNIAEDVPRALVGDPLRLGQVFTNLANNAVKFTETGSILIKADLLYKDEQSCRIRFSVKDTGIGMTPEQIGKLFTAFSQADTSVTRKYGGTGLGLSISKRLVEMMSGEIAVQSIPGAGSTFSFTAAFSRQPEEKEYSLLTPPDLVGLKVLIVDDNETAREILTEQIKSLRLDAVSVESGERAIAELKQAANGKPYDLVLMDWKMPEMDGIEAAKLILEDTKLGHTPLIVMISAFGREEVIKRAEQAGINAFLMKPVNQSLLFETILQSFHQNFAGFNDYQALLSSSGEVTEGLEGVRVLLVEDNLMNQQVAMEILKGAGLSVSLANNGKEALEAAAESDYDIVLMDVQMPVMGGYEATRLLRADKRHANLPIVAMTAHAMQGAKEECLEAGMNDYVSKPIDPEQLFSVLAKWAKGQGEKKETVRPTKGQLTPQSTEQPLQQPAQVKGEDSERRLPKSLAGVDIETGLKRLNGNENLYIRLLLDFAEKYASFAETLKNELNQADSERAVRLAHTLKGVAGNLSISGVYNLASELEATIIEKYEPNATPKSRPKLDRLLVEIHKELQRVILSLNEWQPERETASQGGSDRNFQHQSLPHKDQVNEASPCNESTINRTEIRANLSELGGLLDEDNIDAAQSLEALKKRMGKTLFKKEIQELDKHIRNYDFDAAKQSLQKIALGMDLAKGDS